MQTTTQTSDTGVSTGGADADGFTAAELAYLSSGGKDSAALEQEWGSAGSGEGVAGDQQPAAGSGGQDKTAASGDPSGSDDDAVEGEIVIDASGRAKDKTTGRFVPHKAHHALREKYKATRDELGQARETITKFNERISVLSELFGKQDQQPEQQQQAEKDEPAPDPEKDIFAFVKWQAKQIEKLTGALNEKAGKFEAHTAEQQFRQSYIGDATAFVQKTPDFRDAYAHLITGRDAELSAVGMADPAARKAHIAREEKALVQQALQQGVSPSQVLYNLAKARGYAGPKASAVDPKASDPVKKIEQIANGQKAAGNNFSGAGGSGGEGLTVEAFLSMDEAEYAKAMEKLSPSQRRALLGG